MSETTLENGTAVPPNCSCTAWLSCSAPVTVPLVVNGTVLPFDVTATVYPPSGICVPLSEAPFHVQAFEPAAALTVSVWTALPFASETAMVTGPAVVVVYWSVAYPLCNGTVVPENVTSRPTRLDAWLSCCDRLEVSRLLSVVLVEICSATDVNCTSWLVNSFVSIGAVGSWFFSWVVSNERKSVKLPASYVSVLVEDTAEAALLVPAVVTAAVAAFA